MNRNQIWCSNTSR